MILIKEICERTILDTLHIRYLSFDFDGIIEPFRTALIQLFSLPIEMMSFKKLHDLIILGKTNINRSGAIILFPQAIDRLKLMLDEAKSMAEQAEARAEQAEARAEQAEARARQAEVKARQAETRTQSIRESRSWKITEPLRALGRWRLKRAIKILLTDPRLFVKKIVIKLLRKVSKIGLIKRTFLLLVHPFPQLKARLKTIVHGSSGGNPGKNIGFGSDRDSDLSPWAQQIYKGLENAKKQKKKQGK
jgi:O-antigen chain-terminating methyltransferase